MTSERTIERLSLYRRLADQLMAEGIRSIYSHQLAERVGGTAAQVRRDLMEIGFGGNSRSGYDVSGLSEKLGDFLDAPEGDDVALIGVGNLGRALLHFFNGRHTKLKVVAAFDTDAQRTGRVIHGCRCYPMESLEEVLKKQSIRVAILAIPATAAQQVATRLIEVGVTGILNFAPAHIHARVRAKISIENMDMTTALEKVAFLARRQNDGATTP